MLKEHYLNIYKIKYYEGKLRFCKITYLELGDILNPDVISDRSHDNSDFVITASHLHLTDLIKDKTGRPEN